MPSIAISDHSYLNFGSCNFLRLGWLGSGYSMTSIVLKCGHIHHLTLRDYGIRRRRSIQEWELQHGRHDLMRGAWGGGHERIALIGFRSRRGEGLLQTPHLRFGSDKRIFHFVSLILHPNLV